MWGNLAIGALAAIVHFAVVRLLLELIFFAAGWVVSWWRTRARKPQLRLTDASITATIAAEALCRVIIALVGVALFSLANVWPAWRGFWMSDVLLLVALLSVILRSGSASSYIPIVRQQVVFARVMALPISALLLLHHYKPTVLTAVGYSYGMVASYVCLVAITVLGYLYSRRKLKTFSDLDERHDSVLASLEDLSSLVQFFGTSEGFRGAREALSQARSASRAAFSLLKEDAPGAAEAALIHAEAELDYITDVLRDRIRLSLPDELEATLEQSKRDLESLKHELSSAGLDAGILNEFSSRIEVLEASIESVPTSHSALRSWLKPFDHLRDDLADIRTSLRFRQNSKRSLDRITAIIRQGKEKEKLFGGLDLPGERARERRERLEGLLSEFQGASGQLVVAYQGILKRLQEYRREISLLDRHVASSCQQLELVPSLLIVYVPKFVSTSEAVSGVISFRSEGFTGGRITLDGTLLEFQARTDFEIDTASGTEPIRFTFAGKRDGIASLTATLVRREEPELSHTVKITVYPSFTELSKKAIVFLPLTSAFVALLLWGQGVSLKTAAQVGATTGSILLAAALLVGYLLIRRKKQQRLV